MTRYVLVLLATTVLAALSGANAFAPVQQGNRVATTTTSTQLHFGIPTFGPKKDDDEPKDPNLEKEEKIGLKGLVQLLTSGAGAPFLGDFQGVDKETGNFMFSLEANNLVDENGASKQTSMPYFENGWVDPEDEKKAKEGFKFPWQK
jgi:hypothetical protein